MKSQRGMGGVVSNIMYRNVTGGVVTTGAVVTMCHHNWTVGTLPVPTWVNISFVDVDLNVQAYGTFQGKSG
jgi:hypothetical protein